MQITSRDGVSCLTISTITADDSGKYVVSVENSHGADCHFASVAVEGEFFLPFSLGVIYWEPHTLVSACSLYI